MREAMRNRLRRIYLPLLVVLLAAWLFRITAFVHGEDLLTTASIAVVPGPLVVTAVGVFYALLVGIVLWPREREAMGEFREGDIGEWKDDH